LSFQFLRLTNNFLVFCGWMTLGYALIITWCHCEHYMCEICEMWNW